MSSLRSPPWFVPLPQEFFSKEARSEISIADMLGHLENRKLRQSDVQYVCYLVLISHEVARPIGEFVVTPPANQSMDNCGKVLE